MSVDPRDKVLNAEAAIREMAAELAVTTERGKALKNAQAALDQGLAALSVERRELHQLSEDLRRTQQEQNDSLQRLLAEFRSKQEALLALARERMDRLEAEIQSRAMAQESAWRDVLTSHAVDARRLLLDTVAAIRDAESSLGAGAELLQSYSDGYRAAWTRSAESIARRFEEAARLTAGSTTELRDEIRERVERALTALEQAASKATMAADLLKGQLDADADPNRDVRKLTARFSRWQQALLALGIFNLLLSAMLLVLLYRQALSR